MPDVTGSAATVIQRCGRAWVNTRSCRSQVRERGRRAHLGVGLGRDEEDELQREGDEEEEICGLERSESASDLGSTRTRSRRGERGERPTELEDADEDLEPGVALLDATVGPDRLEDLPAELAPDGPQTRKVRDLR